jgi:hypothetical protein
VLLFGLFSLTEQHFRLVRPQVFRSNVQGMFDQMRIAHVVVFVISILWALITWLMIVRPMLKHSGKESRQIAEMLSQLPPEMDVEGLVTQAIARTGTRYLFSLGGGSQPLWGGLPVVTEDITPAATACVSRGWCCATPGGRGCLAGSCHLGTIDGRSSQTIYREHVTFCCAGLRGERGGCLIETSAPTAWSGPATGQFTGRNCSGQPLQGPDKAQCFHRCMVQVTT